MGQQNQQKAQQNVHDGAESRAPVKAKYLSEGLAGQGLALLRSKTKMQKRASHQHLRGLLFSEKLLWPNQTVFKVIFRRFFSTSAFDHFLVANKEVITRERIGSRRE